MASPPPRGGPPGAGDRYEQANSGVVVHAVQHGNQYVYHYTYTASPAYTVQAFEQRRQLPPSADLALSRLLVASYQVVPFTGRDQVRGQLTTWLDDDAPVSVRLVHGPGGQGKTRLAARVADDARTAGWAVAAATHTPDAAGPAAAEVTGHRGLLLVVDYAERWPSAVLLSAISDHARAGQRLRVLLLARPAGGWWDGLSYRLDHDLGIENADAIGLDTLARTPPDREAVFREAVAALAPHVPGRRPREVASPDGLATDARYDLTLTVHMAALVALDTQSRGREAVPADGLSRYLLQRERDHWRRLHDAGRITVTDRTIGHLTYLAALTRALPYPDAITATICVGIADETAAADAVLADHALVYPPTDPATRLEPLYPDRLAEDYLALTTPGCPGNTPTDPWATPVADHLLNSDNPAAEPPPYARALLGMLIEAAARWPHLAHQVLEPLLTQHPQLAPVAGGAALVRISEFLDPDRLRAIAGHLPQTRHLDLDPAALAVTERIVGHLNTRSADDVQRAPWLGRLGNSYSFMGRREEALAATGEAVEIYRRLAVARPDAFEPDLAMALNNLGMMLSNLGRREEALATTGEAVEIYRRLAVARPDAFEPDLAMALNNLGMMLSNLGRREEALATTGEAIEIYRRLAVARPDAFEPDLATALNNLGAMLSNLGRREEALATTGEAIKIYRRLAVARPDAFEPDLATALNNLGAMLSNLGRREEALAATGEAIEIRRRLAVARPDAFEPDLATALNNLGIQLSNLGRREEALATTEQAIKIYRRLAVARPDAFEPDLATALNNLSVDLSNLGRREEALAATEQAIEIRRRLAVARPDAFEPDLATALNNLGAMLSNLGRREEALAATEQAIKIYRRLAVARPDAFEPDLATVLNNLGIRLSNLGRREEALAATEQAIEIRRRLAVARPDAFEPDLARSLWAVGWVVAATAEGCPEAVIRRAVESTVEAVELFEDWAARHPQAFGGALESARVTHDQLRKALKE